MTAAAQNDPAPHPLALAASPAVIKHEPSPDDEPLEIPCAKAGL